ncbi:chemotaxis protein CheW [Desulfitobacterium sp.]|uniref:chemotaxis protein CheW n=1 Tax=Desulfitobacterium sp. TaxID=49981 RepID=UPI002B1F6D19|nr:chemotaxis protein CheW [Desulfitobacterium sp.]MEA4902678.1 chemotaxis protein CheW [Desulfitobacterium sp.]
MDQYVIFTLGEQEYGIDIYLTKEILRIPQITNMPNTPAFIEGVINLRGIVIPIIDLKKKFKFAQVERSVDNRLLILDLEGMNLGLIVDDVSEVIRIDEQEIEKLSTEICTMGANSLQGIAKVNERLILLLNASELKKEIFKYEHESELSL